MTTTTLLIPTLLMSVVADHPADEQALVQYRTAVNAHVQLHRDAAAVLPIGALCGGLEQVELTRSSRA